LLHLQPYNKDGSILTGIVHTSNDAELANGVISNHSFSNRPPNGYSDYYEKFMGYLNILMSPAYSIDNSVTAKTFNVINISEESVFNYLDTNTSRAEIGVISQKLENHKIGIVGLGGTGSYVLDLVAKTPVSEIHLFDGDVFSQHNAFRSPGAPDIEKLREKCRKSDYFCDLYKKMHKYVISHNEYIDATNVNSLLSLDFVFICIDKGKIKRETIDNLVKCKISFIDVGIGIEVVDNSLIGQVRITASTPEKREHISNRISFSNVEEDEYSTNIQIADLNALNATLAVIQWKKLNGFYQDVTKAFNTVYSINDGELFNDEY